LLIALLSQYWEIYYIRKCGTELNWLDMAINIKKTCWLPIGPRADDDDDDDDDAMLY